MLTYDAARRSTPRAGIGALPGVKATARGIIQGLHDSSCCRAGPLAPLALRRALAIKPFCEASARFVTLERVVWSH